MPRPTADTPMDRDRLPGADRGAWPPREPGAPFAAIALLNGRGEQRLVSARLYAALATIVGGELPAAWLTARTLGAAVLPAAVERGSELAADLAWRQALRRTPPPPARVLLANDFRLAFAALARAPGADWIVALEATPAMLRRDPPLGAALVKGSVARLRERRFRTLTRRVGAWLPVSARCRSSLVEDYGVAAERCFVTRSPQPHLVGRSHRKRRPTPPYRFLFVGDEFRASGGDLVVAACAHLGSALCTATIVSSDPSLAAATLPPHVRLIQGVADRGAIRPWYRDADLFVLPASQDGYPHAICESFAEGTPILACYTGNAAELIAESRAGWALAPKPSADALATAMLDAVADGDAHARRAANALEFAHVRLGPATLTKLLRQCLLLPPLHKPAQPVAPAAGVAATDRPPPH